MPPRELHRKKIISCMVLSCRSLADAATAMANKRYVNIHRYVLKQLLSLLRSSMLLIFIQTKMLTHVMQFLPIT